MNHWILVALILQVICTETLAGGWSKWSSCRNGWQTRSRRSGRQTLSWQRRCTNGREMGTSGGRGKGTSGACSDTRLDYAKYKASGYCKREFATWMKKCKTCTGRGKGPSGGRGKGTSGGRGKGPSGGRGKGPSGGRGKVTSGGGKEVTTTGSNGLEDQCTKSANSYRGKHINTPDLEWNPSLARKAQAYANLLLENAMSNRRGWFTHDRKNKKEKMGENLWYQDNLKAGTCENADKDWYAEIKDWNYRTCRSNGGATGHFTQMVWVDTTIFGVGVAVGKSPRYKGNKITIVVAKYKKRGNFNWVGKRVRDYTRNVRRLL